MKVKKLLSGIVGHHILRHRQHKRLLRNALMQARHFGPGKGLLMLGALALGGYYMQRRHAAHTTPEIPETGMNY